MLTNIVIQLEIYRSDLQSRIAALRAEERDVTQCLEEQYATAAVAVQYIQDGNSENLSCRHATRGRDNRPCEKLR